MNNLINYTATEFANKIKSYNSPIIIDVRTLEEFNNGHIPNSILIDFYGDNFKNKILSLDKDKVYFVYCRSGNRSYHACNFMLSSGFKNIYHLKTGIISWEDELQF